MPFDSLRDFVNAVDSLGELRVIGEADSDLEVGAVTEVAAGAPSCPMLLFEKIRGAHQDYRLVTNLLHSPRRLALALGIPSYTSAMEIVRQWKAKLAGSDPIEPVFVSDSSAPVKWRVLTGEGVDLTKLPAPRWHELDGGRYLGAGAITILRDQDGGWVNLGIYRLQLHDANTLALFISPGKQATRIMNGYWDQGLACPVAVSLGHDPSLFLAANHMEPWGSSEYGLAGLLRGEPVKVVEGELTGLPVPASSEIVLEGEVPVPSQESRLEGPFGEATGYYASAERKEPVIKVKLVMERERPILHGAPPMRPIAGLYHFAVNWRAAAIWNDLDKLGFTDVMGVWQYDLGITVISVKQQYAGHAKQVALAALASRSSYLERYVIMVDENIDPANLPEVMWALSSRTDPSESIDIIRGCWSSRLDPRITPDRKAHGDLTTSRAIIDTCRPFHWRADFPPVNRVSPEMVRQVVEKWGSTLGL